MENMEARKISLDLIDPDPGQPRKNKPLEYLRELGESMKNKGLRNAIHIRENPDVPGKFLIVNGECRWTAAVLVGMKEIEAKIFDYSGENTDGEVFIDQIMDNVVRKDMDPLETLQSYQKALDMGMSIDDLAKAFGKSRELIEKDLPILKLPKLLLDAYDTGALPKTVARKLAELSGHKAMLKAWEWACKMRNTNGMLAKIGAYQNAQAQMSLFDDALGSATSEEKKSAKICADKLMRAITEFKGTPFANGKGELLMVVNSRKLDNMKILADEMAKISTKLKSDILAYESQRKNAVA